MRTGKSCTESQWEKIWFLGYKAIKGTHLKLHILIFHRTYAGCYRKWVQCLGTLHVLVDHNRSRWGAWAVLRHCVVKWAGWGNITLLNFSPVTTPAVSPVRISHLQDWPPGKVTGALVRLMALKSVTLWHWKEGSLEFLAWTKFLAA